MRAVPVVSIIVALAGAASAAGCKNASNGAGAASAVKFAQNIDKLVNTANKAVATANDAVNAANTAVSVTSAAVSAVKGGNAEAGGAPAPQLAVGPTGSGQAAMQSDSVNADSTGAPTNGAAASSSTPGGVASKSSPSTTAFAGTWLCAAGADLTAQGGKSFHVQGGGAWIVVDNNDGTISLIDPNNHDPCLPTRWLVSGTHAEELTDRTCTKPDGSFIRPLQGKATLSGRSMTADGTVSVAGNTGALQIAFQLRCGRR